MLVKQWSWIRKITETYRCSTQYVDLRPILQDIGIQVYVMKQNTMLLDHMVCRELDMDFDRDDQYKPNGQSILCHTDIHQF